MGAGHVKILAFLSKLFMNEMRKKKKGTSVESVFYSGK